MNTRRPAPWIRLVVGLLVVAVLLAWLRDRPAAWGPNPTAPASATGDALAPDPGGGVPTAGDAAAGLPGRFDFYVLVLSWSPDYCAESGMQDPQQCSVGRRLGFVLHGLWPQFNRGYPTDCSSVRLGADVKARFPGLYPSPKLYDHEWTKHGTCSGLAPEQYLALSKRLKSSVVIPDDYRAPVASFRSTSNALVGEFLAANPQLGASGVAAFCSGSGRYLQGLYVCYTPDGRPTACSAEIYKQAARSCGRPDFTVRSVR